MKKIKRIAILVLALMLVCAVFVACNDKNNAGVNGGQPTQKVERKPTADPDSKNPYDVSSENEDFSKGDWNFDGTAVIIFFTNTESLNNLFYDYVLEDFDTTKFKSIRESFPYELKRIREKYLNGTIDKKVKEYNRSLRLELITPSKDRALQYIEEFRQDKGIRNAEPELYGEWFATTNDPLLSYQQDSYNKIQLFDAWDTTTGSSNVKVGVVDTNIICAVGTNEAERRRTCLEH